MSHEWQKLNFSGYWRCYKCCTSMQADNDRVPSPDLKRSVLVADDEGIYHKTELLSCDEIIIHRINAS